MNTDAIDMQFQAIQDMIFISQDTVTKIKINKGNHADVLMDETTNSQTEKFSIVDYLREQIAKLDTDGANKQ